MEEICIYNQNLLTKQKSSTNIKFVILLIIIILSILAVSLLIPSIAYADGLDEFLSDPFGFICKFVFGAINKIFCEIVNGAYWAMLKFMDCITPSDLLTGEWTKLFGDKGVASGTIFGFVTTICNSIVKPIAGTILACVFLMQFLKIAGKADTNGTVPLFKDIFTMFVIFMIFNWLVGHADQVCGAIYDIINVMSKSIKQYAHDFEFQNITQDLISVDNWDDVSQFAKVNIGAILSILVCCALGMLGGIVAFIFACVATYARALQLYVYATFSPIPFAMLGFEETRQWGIGYFKNFASVALAGAILLFIMFAFPAIFVAVVSVDTGSTMLNLADLVTFSGGINASINVLKMLAIIIVFILGIVKSGTWAKDVLGS